MVVVVVVVDLVIVVVHVVIVNTIDVFGIVIILLGSFFGC